MAALVVAVGAAAAAFQIDPEVVVRVSTAPTGLWIPVPTTGEIVRVDAGTGAVTARVAVSEPRAELELAERESGVVVVDRTTGRVALVDPALHRITREVRTVAAAPGLVDIGPESIVVASGTRLAVVDLDVTGAASVLVARPVRSVASQGAGAVEENGEELTEVDSRGAVGESRESSGLLVRVVDRVVVVTAEGVEDQAGTRLSCFESPVDSPDHVIGTAENWVVVIEGSMVQVSDLGNGQCASVDLGPEVGELGRPVVADRRVYVPERTSGVVHIVNPSLESVQSHSVFSPGDLRLRSRGDFVAAYDTETAVAALLDTNGVVRFVDTVGNGIQAVLDETASAAVLGGDETGVSSALGGVDGVSASSDAPIIDAGVLATMLRNPEIEGGDVPVDELVANFAFSASTVTVGESVRFVDGSTGMPDSWMWDFGDGTGAEGPEVEKAWSESGTYPVTLRVSRGEESAEISLAITVVPAELPLPPAADFTLSGSVVNVGDSLRFEDRSDGEIDRWRWDFGDGTTASIPDVTKAWQAPGRYTVSLTVANQQGTDSTSVVIVVVEGLVAPVAVIAAENSEVDLGAPLSFRGSSSTDPATFSWNFGDGRTSTGSDVVHVFLEQGIFTVRLTAENDAGSSTAVVEILVTPPTLPPSAAIAALPFVIEVGDVVSLASLSTNSPDTEDWSFGDGDAASGREVTHTWTTEGTFLLTLTATNEAGTNAITEIVEVVAELPPPLAQIGAFDASPWVGETTVFSDASIDATAWLWDFGDGVTSNARDPLHTFTSAGQKIVTLTVSNRNGTDSVAVVVEPRLEPIADFTVPTTAIRAGDDLVFSDGSVNAVSWTWDFGDGTGSSVQNPVHTFTSTGAFSVLLTIENGTGDTDTFGPVVINVDPAAPLLSGIQLVPDDAGVVITLESVTLDAEPAVASGPIDLYQVDFGDGSAFESGTLPRFSHVFGASGNYDVRMQARGPLGDWSEWVTRTVSVVDPAPPLVSIADSVPSSALVGNVTLTGVVTDGSGPIENWRWEVTRSGNLSNYTGQVAVHNFDSAGVYRITLIAEGPVVDTVVAQDITITVPPAPTIVSLTANPSPATTGVPVEFTPVVTGSVTTWEWDFEGGGYVTLGPTGAHIFNTAGPQEVYLRITGPFGGQDVMSVSLTVNPRPAPSAPVASPAGTVTTGTTVNLSSTDAGGLSGLVWDWQLTNGTTTSSFTNAGPSIDYLFASAGSWTVTVTATDALGESGTNVSFVTVQDPVPPLNASFTWSATGVLQIQFTDTSTGPPVDSWTWDFGSASAVGSTTTASPLVTYPGAGMYSVTLTVGSGADPPDSVTVVVTVP